MFAQLFGATGTPIPALAWYKLDGNALDSSGNGYHGTWWETEAYASGKYGQAGGFSAQGAIASGLASSSLVFPFTVCAWVSPGDVSIADRSYRIITRSYPGGVTRGGMQVVNYQLSVNFDGGAKVDVGPIPTNAWTHVSVVFRSDGWTCATNGIAAASGAQVPSVGGATVVNIGAGASSHNILQFVGAIDDVRFYGVGLSDGNIKRIMESQNNEPLEELQ